MNYDRWTFRLSVIGFIGSIGFYYGVLRKVYSGDEEKQQIEQLTQENHLLKDTIEALVEK